MHTVLITDGNKKTDTILSYSMSCKYIKGITMQSKVQILKKPTGRQTKDNTDYKQNWILANVFFLPEENSIKENRWYDSRTKSPGMRQKRRTLNSLEPPGTLQRICE